MLEQSTNDSTVSPLSALELGRKANQLRLIALEMIYRAGSGHPGSAFSAAEIITTLYYSVLRIRPSEPLWPLRDRVVLSKGHACSILYAALADLGFYPTGDLNRFREIGSHLQGHPKLGTPGIDVSTGSLGAGASVATGFALAGRHQGFSTYAILSDGEANAGIVWEAALFAAHHRLSNLTFVLDRNMLQYTGPTEKVLALEPLHSKWASFGWEVIEVDGHDTAELHSALQRRNASGPRIVIAHTIKGRGVSFMENALTWHGTAHSTPDYETAKAELLKLI